MYRNFNFYRLTSRLKNVLPLLLNKTSWGKQMRFILVFSGERGFIVCLEYFSLNFDRNRVFPIYSTLLEWMVRFSVGWYLKLLDIPNFTGSSYSMRKRTAPKQWDRLNMAETGGTRRDVSTGSTPQRPVPMKLFATWEVERTSPNCVPRWVLLKTIFFFVSALLQSLEGKLTFFPKTMSCWLRLESYVVRVYCWRSVYVAS